MFCIKCGNELPEGSRFCNKCGYSFRGNAVKRYRSKSWIPMLIVLISAAVTAASCFLPYYSISLLGVSVNASYWESDGKIVFILALISLIMAAIPVKLLIRLSLLPTLGALGVLLYGFITIITHDGPKYGSFSVGFYLIIVGLVGMIVGAVMSFFMD